MDVIQAALAEKFSILQILLTALLLSAIFAAHKLTVNRLPDNEWVALARQIVVMLVFGCLFWQILKMSP